MNIKLVYNKSSFNIDILKDTPSQYLFEVAQKIFRIPMDDISLKYEDIEIKNNSRLIFSVMGKSDPDDITGNEIIIVSNKNKLIKSNNNFSSPNIVRIQSLKLPLIHSSIINSEQSNQIEKTKSKKKAGCSITCQICNSKNSIFYCRVCNLFVCFECNVRFNEHKNHERINLEDGDSFLGCDVYREELINELNIVELGYQKSLQWMIDNEDRENFLQQLFKLLEQIRNNSLCLADMKTLYSLDQETINDFRVEVDKIPKPRHREEIFEIYGSLNLKENELRNYIKFLNLQIIKTEYNKVLLKCLDKVKKNLEILSKEVKLKLQENEEIKFRGLDDVQIYLKESRLEKNKMDIRNYLSKNYKENNNNNNNLNNNIYINNLDRIISKENNNNNDLLNNKNITTNFHLFFSDNNNSKNKNTFNRNNNSLYEKNINKTIEKKNKPIKLIGNDIVNQKKKMKTIDIDTDFNIENKDILSKKTIDLSPIKKNTFSINEKNKHKLKKINLISNKPRLSVSNISDLKFMNFFKNKAEKNINSIIKNNRDKKSGINNKIENDNDLYKLSEENDNNTNNKDNNNDSIYQLLTSSEKKIVFNPPIGIKSNSYGKSILTKQNIII